MSFKKETPLANAVFWAARKGNLALLQLLLNSGRVDADCKDSYGTTALMVASYSGHYDCVKELIMQGADINLQREKNSQASRYLGSSWRTDRHIYVRKLRDSESSHMMLKSGATALFLASQQGHNDIVKLLFEFGASTEFKTKDGGTALSAACQHGRSSVVETLLRNGAGMHDQLNDGATPLFLAAQEGHLTVIRQLLSSGAKVNHPREDGTTPLWMAAQMGHSEVVKVLLLRGAERDADRKHCRPLAFCPPTSRCSHPWNASPTVPREFPHVLGTRTAPRPCSKQPLKDTIAWSRSSSSSPPRSACSRTGRRRSMPRSWVETCGPWCFSCAPMPTPL
ncbi:ankyrin repeat domain-containing protein 29 isoform X2 [Paramormyrops kingsleyae]|uniref:ankyrin repeat domain-containing protein 29 isoform X2 n=1 Tax=Paramormyrops kingsleyae TaxID=1676925 RepID=UPI003B97BF8B